MRNTRISPLSAETVPPAQQYNASGKFVMNTEAAITCGGFYDPPGSAGCESDPTSPFEATKEYYVTQLYATTIAKGLCATTWYSVQGWRNSNLLKPLASQRLASVLRNSELAARNSGLVFLDGSPRQAYYALKFARSELVDAAFAGNLNSSDLGGASGIKGYEFNRGDRTIWILWSQDGAAHSVSVATVPLAIFTPLGTPVPPSAS